MKKLFLLSSITFLFLTLFSSCGDFINNDDIYNSEWEEIEGYVDAKTEKNERTGKDTTTYTFVSGTHPEDKSIAVLYRHKYDKNRTPYCDFIVKTVQNDIDKGIVYEYVEDKDKSDDFKITKTQYTQNTGFIFYCDDEYINVINNLYSLKYLEHDDPNPKNKAEYRFEISISGIYDKLIFEMDYQISKENKPY